MGGDYAPREVVAGTVLAAELPNVSELILVGDETAIKAELALLGTVSPKIKIRHASQSVDMGEAPALAVRRKKDSSIGRAVELVKLGEADAVMSAGNTGAAVAASTLKLRTLEGVDRPAIATVMPTQKSPVVLVDAGANLDCTPEQLVQFAMMGSVYSRVILGREHPIVGLLSIGGEDSKGNEVTKRTFASLQKSSLNFRGNVEGRDIFEGDTDVVVCDGFVGNIVLKTTESTATAVTSWLKRELMANWLRKFACLFLRGAFKSLKRQLDPESYGGAPLLGVNGVCIIAHGRSSRHAVYHAIRVAAESVSGHVNEGIIKGIASLGGTV
ncbi:MAG TPA: phosphate acyltransferase PlsX [Verrucomicrobia bacterium]|nr:phosphate acyltransferase PlsX [Verrucomicrobiota bacterium]